MEPKTRTLLATMAFGLFLPLATLQACKKEEPPPPLPAAKPASTTAPLELKPIDAGKEPDAAPKKGGGSWQPGPSGLAACCAALAQNAANAPAQSKMYMMQAAAMCQAAAAQGKDKATVLTMISGALKGAGVPAACK